MSRALNLLIILAAAGLAFLAAVALAGDGVPGDKGRLCGERPCSLLVY